MATRAAMKKANREALLEAARQVFSTVGYEAATVRDIARASGLASGSFYNYFVDKDEIFGVIVDGTFDTLDASLPAARRSATDLRGFLHGPYRLVVLVALDDPETAAIIARNQTAFRELFYLARAKSSIQRELEADLRDWTASGRMAPHQTGPMAEAMISLGMDLLVQVALDPDSADARVAFLVDLFSRALRPG